MPRLTLARLVVAAGALSAAAPVSALEVHVKELRTEAAMVRAIRLTKGTLPPNPMPLALEIGHRDRIVATGRYYLHVIATIGTLAERDVDDVGDAVFGRPSETNTLGSLGRAIFRTALQISDYLQSVSAEAKSKKISGNDLLKP